MKNNISFVIPCYNSEKTIVDVIQEIKDSIRKGDSYEIILVNDHSTDNVFDVIEKIAKKDKKIKAISLLRNFGQHAALMAGLRYAKGNIIVCLDDDGQTPANECYKLIDEVNKGKDVVYASYGNHKQHSLFRNLGSKANDLMAFALLNKPNGLYMSSYFACKRIIIDEIIKYDKPYPYLGGLILRTTKNISNVSVNHRLREQGKSGYTISKLLGLWMNGFTAFSIKPLRFATLAGFITSMIGFIYGLILVIRKLTNQYVIIGYASMMAAILFVGGMIMIMLGLIGEYVGRIYICINNQPQYIIEKFVGFDK